MQSAARPSRGAPATGPASDTRNTYGTEREKESDKKCGKEAEDPFGKKLKQSPDFFPGNENGRASLEEIAVLLHRLRRVSTSVGSQSPSGPSLPTRPGPLSDDFPKAADVFITDVEVPERCRHFYYKCRVVRNAADVALQIPRCRNRCRIGGVRNASRHCHNICHGVGIAADIPIFLQTSRCRMLQTFYHRRRGVRDATDIPF